MPLLIKACLNGGRLAAAHPAVPITAEQLARDAVAARAAGAGAVHVHPRGPDGQQSLDAAAIGDAVAAIRAACPGLPVGVSTIASAEPAPARRLETVKNWRVLPDFASVNMAE